MKLVGPSFALALALASSPAFAAAEMDGVSVELRPVAEGFSRPLLAISPPGDPRLFVVEKTGRIRILVDGQVAAQPFLDISGSISDGNEQGLLGLAFHPDFSGNGRFFVNYTDAQGDTRIVEYTAQGDVADPATARELLMVDQPASNHNGGWIEFGPDGLLYIGMGDGGGAGDRRGNAQNPEVLLGKILRIDVDGGEPYAIPQSNPFADGNAGAPEIFALGLRNPWRASFDGGDLYIADVGQNAFEEIDVLSAATGGSNLGWNKVEGNACYPEGADCSVDGYHPPVHVYGRDLGCSITGGFVYRGAAIPALDGRYFYADYCMASLASFRYADGAVTDLIEPINGLAAEGPITSFGMDSAGELYVLTDDGDLLKLVAAD